MGTDGSVGPDASTGGVELDADHITTSTRDPAETAGRLQEWLGQTLEQGSHPTITDVASPEGNGMSSETLLFTAEWTVDGAVVEHRLVARIEPPDTAYPVFT
ncbi:MAG TPA: hypothetical protein VHW93_04965, partial [Acidimicrobiales bacterium]|nr:hypothetical protein [Acidimicrobiales bacterium]